MNGKRIEWIEISKGIGIILVIIGHNTMLNNKSWIYSFHMPLFFFLTGCTYYLSSNNKFFVKIIKGIIIPYLFFSILRLLYYQTLNTLSLGDVNLLDKAYGILVDMRKTDYAIGLWYLNCLFVTKIAVYIIDRFKLKYKYLIFFWGFVSIGIMYKKFINDSLPWGIDVVPFSASLVVLGIIFMKHYKTRNKIAEYISIPFLLLIVIYFSKTNSVEMYDNRYGNYISFYIVAISGILFIIFLSKIMTNTNRIKKIFIFIGSNSIYYYCLQSMASNILNIMQAKIAFAYNPYEKIAFIVLRTIITIVLLYLPVILCKQLIGYINNGLSDMNQCIIKIKSRKELS